MTDRSPSEGWVTFSALALGVAGAIHVIVGVLAMYQLGPFKPEAVPVNIYGWGLTMVFMGAAAVVCGFLINGRQNLGRIGGLILASLSLAMWAMWLGNNPSSTMIAPLLDVLVLFGLSVTKEYFS